MYSAYTKEQAKLFVARHGDEIIKAITDQELFFPTVVGQLSMESTWGESGLSSKYNNYGGIKSTGSIYTSGSVRLDTLEVIKSRDVAVQDAFATYDDFPNFMADYVRVLHLPHYVAAGVFTAKDPYEQILAIGKGGYSTRDPQEYLKRARGRMEACMDLFPWGKISSSATIPGTTTTSVSNPVADTLNSALGGLFGLAASMGIKASQNQPVL